MKNFEDTREEVMMRPSECLDTHMKIEEKVRVARELYEQFGEELKRQPKIASLIQDFQRYIENTWQVMRDIGVVETCSVCDTAEGGSCCGRGIEDKYNSLLLLMNLLMDVRLPDERLRGDSCYFLTDTGCGLKARLVLCVDYLCPRLQKKLTHENLVRLQTISGDELLTEFILHDEIRDFIQRQQRQC